MIWQTILVAFLAVGVFGEYKISDAQREQFKGQLKEFCKKSGNEDKAEAVETSIKNFVECGKSLFDPDTLKKEIEEAKPNGALDEVFKKYCAKSPQLKTCIHTLTSGVMPCVDVNWREEVTHLSNSTDQLIDFLCYKDGDRIALFIAEGGPECFQEKSSSILACFNILKESITNIDQVRNMNREARCAKFDETSSCVVKALEECSTPTPGNMAESLFRYIKKGTACNK